MKKIILFLFLINPNLYAQIDSYSQKENYPEEVEKFYEQLKKALAISEILVPFVENEKYGYLDQKTLEVMVDPVAESLNLIRTDFHNYHIGIYDKTFWIVIEKGELILKHIAIGVQDDPGPENWVRSSFGAKRAEDKKFRGFTYEINADGTPGLLSYSQLYYVNSQNIPQLTLFKINGDVYAIAQLDHKKSVERRMGIIKPNGEYLNGFDFNYNDILPVVGLKPSNETWFLVRELNSENNNHHFINSKGQLLPKSTLPDLYYATHFVKTKYSTPYYELVSTIGYVVNSNNIVDLYDMKKVDVLDKDMKAFYLNYINLSNDDSYMSIEEKRKNSLMFASVEDASGQWMYIDFNGKKYRPQPRLR